MAVCRSIASAYDTLQAAVLHFLHLRRAGASGYGRSTKPLNDSSSQESVVRESVLEAAERISKEFEFSRDDLRKAVKAFIQQLGQLQIQDLKPDLC